MYFLYLKGGWSTKWLLHIKKGRKFSSKVSEENLQLFGFGWVEDRDPQSPTPEGSWRVWQRQPGRGRAWDGGDFWGKSKRQFWLFVPDLGDWHTENSSLNLNRPISYVCKHRIEVHPLLDPSSEYYQKTRAIQEIQADLSPDAQRPHCWLKVMLKSFFCLWESTFTGHDVILCDLKAFTSSVFK